MKAVSKEVKLSRDLVPSELLAELVDSIASVKGQLSSLDTFEHWLRSMKDVCIPPKDIQNWIEEHRKNILKVKKLLVDGAREIVQKTANETVDPVKTFERVLLTERVASRFLQK